MIHYKKDNWKVRSSSIVLAYIYLVVSLFLIAVFVIPPKNPDVETSWGEFFVKIGISLPFLISAITLTIFQGDGKTIKAYFYWFRKVQWEINYDAIKTIKMFNKGEKYDVKMTVSFETDDGEFEIKMGDTSVKEIMKLFEKHHHIDFYYKQGKEEEYTLLKKED